MYTPVGDAMIHRTRRENKSRKNDDSDGDNSEKMETIALRQQAMAFAFDKSSNRAPEGEKKMVGNKEGEGEKKRKEKWEMMVRR
jgi:hypothetical protein